LLATAGYVSDLFSLGEQWRRRSVTRYIVL
jgi:hypothetical protein